MEINKINSALSTEISTKKESATLPELKDKKPVSQALPQKAVSDDWHLLARSQTQLQQIEDVDRTKMAEIRQSLRDGSFELNLAAISESMLQQHG
ncbi:flagellar biosynthesis anti-sigma factor FlgM [Shewanella canadensis]|uniref:Negative regulator of flagellin synthesis n=1 Tax=Shewanella canadensis TaxID=271096 RepID=A0A431WT45_9GAMM|nr:flagellar biosynthesis anti-sigma factor FlgM [Shewanella canadensis]RTR38294.1 flagellar biosynthesis anti-sigma factor FlgM [Shewanella canadensis]